MVELSDREERSIGKSLALYRSMRKIRAFEETCLSLSRQGKTRGGLHLSIGQEAVAVGLCSQLSDRDYMTTTHRGHGHCIAKGADLGRMAAEILGREAGLCHGRGGSMHLADPTLGMLGANAIVGAGIPIAVGAGLAVQCLGADAVSVAVFGEGAVGEGVFHESLNLAALWKLPVLFVCENNSYAEMTHVRYHLSNPEISTYGAQYHIPSATVDGNGVDAVRNATADALSHVRGGSGPFLLECHTYRLMGHFVGDQERYRDREEVESWRSRDPLVRAASELDDAAVSEIDEEVTREVAEAFKWAESASLPDVSTLLENVFP